MRVLVCGGRDFGDKDRAYAFLDLLCEKEPISTVIHGGASGADYIAHQWAEDRGVNCTEYPADWNRYGRAAGPIRNQQMVDDGRPDVVVAFPGGSGTADMVRRAEAAGIKVIRLPPVVNTASPPAPRTPPSDVGSRD